MNLRLFWSKVRVGAPTECWPFIGHIEHGYGKYGKGPGTRLAHRIAYVLANGPISDDLTVDHLCHNGDPECPSGDECQHRRCCNPAHHEAVPAGVNILRGNGLAAVQARSDTCKRGHPWTPENTYSYTKRDGSSGRRCRACRPIVEGGRVESRTDGMGDQ